MKFMSFSSFAASFACLIVLLVLTNSSPVNDQLRRKRSVVSLGEMITKMTGRSPVLFVSYGSWCGFGGEGKPLDQIDQCCMHHDKCYDAATEGGPCQELSEHPLFVNYSWEHTHEHGLICHSTSDNCALTVCGCDVLLADCFRHYNHTYNPANRLRNLKLVKTLKKSIF